MKDEGVTYGKPQESLTNNESTRNSLLAQGIMQRRSWGGRLGDKCVLTSSFGAKVLELKVLLDRLRKGKVSVSVCRAECL